MGRSAIHPVASIVRMLPVQRKWKPPQQFHQSQILELAGRIDRRSMEEQHIASFMPDLLLDDITHENALSTVEWLHRLGDNVPAYLYSQWRIAAKRIMSRVLAQGFKTTTPEVHRRANGLLITGVVSRRDGCGTRDTCYNMWTPQNTIIPAGALVLVPYPMCRPDRWTVDSQLKTTFIDYDHLVFVNPDLV